MQWAIFIILLFLICLAIVRLPFFQKTFNHTATPVILLGLKCLGALVLWYIYTYYYTNRSTADIYKYFDDAMALNPVLKEHPWEYIKLCIGLPIDRTLIWEYLSKTQHWDAGYTYNWFNDNRSIIRIHLWMGIFSSGNFFTHLLFFSLLSFIGSWALLRFFIEKLTMHKWAAIGIVFLLPSVALFISGPLKESVFLFWLGILIFSLGNLPKNRVLYSLLSLIAIGGLASIKAYFLLPVLMSIFLAWLYYKKGYKLTLITILTSIVVGIILIYSVPQIADTISKKQTNFLASAMQAGSFIDVRLISTATDLLLSTPQCFNHMWLMPYPQQISNLLYLPSIVENIIIFILVIAALSRLKKVSLTKIQQAFILGSLVFVGTSTLLIGWVTPVLGAIVRYRSPLLIFLVATLWLINQKAWLSTASS